MKIYVCVKPVPDSAANITIIEDKRIDEQVTFLLNPYDENAIAEAVKIKNQIENSEIIAISVGNSQITETLRSALAMGADRAIHIETTDNPDSSIIAKALHKTILKDGMPDLVLMGKESIDSEGMQTMFRLAANLEIPVANNVFTLEIENRTALVQCGQGNGNYEKIKMDLPCVIGASKALNKPKYPTLPQIIQSKKKFIECVNVNSLVSKAPESQMTILNLKPIPENRKCLELEGSIDQKVEKLFNILKNEAKVI